MSLTALICKWSFTRGRATSRNAKVLLRYVAASQNIHKKQWQQKLRVMSTQSSNANSEQKEWEIVDNEEDEYSAIPWRYLIEPAAKALWRSSPHNPPFDLADESHNIIQASNKSTKQLRHAHNITCTNHASLAVRRERERRDEVNGKRKKKDDLGSKDNRHSKIKQPVYYNPDQTLAYMKFRLLPNYAIAKRVLMEAQSLIGPSSSWKPRRIIDFGIGCGSASAAAMDVFSSQSDDDNNRQTSIEWIHGIDASQSMRDGSSRILQRLLKQYKSTNQPRVTLSESLSTERSGTVTTQGGFDVALCTYTATELPQADAMLAAAAILWEKLRPNGIFVMIEPGTPDGFNSIRAVRSMLLDCCPPDNRSNNPGDEQCHVIAPCTHNGICPMERHQRNFFKKDAYQEIEGEESDDDESTEESDEYEYDEDSEIDWDEDESDEDDDDEFDWDEFHAASMLLPQEHPLDFQQKSTKMLDKRRDLTAKRKSKIPMSETDMYNRAFCSFVHKFPSGKRGSKGEKFSYLVLQKRVVNDSIDWDEDSFDSSVVDLLAKSHEAGKSINIGKRKRKHTMKDPATHEQLIKEAQELHARYLESNDDKLGLELVRGDSNRKSFGRIVRSPNKKRGHIYIDYCSGNLENGDGRIIRHTLSKSWCKHIAPGLYSAGRKASWGGYWPDLSERINTDK